MGFLTFRFSTCSLQLMFYLCLGSLTADVIPGTEATQSTTTRSRIDTIVTVSQRDTTSITQPHSTQGPFKSTTSLINPPTAPKNVEDFRAINQNESSITLQWTMTEGITLYTLKFPGSETNFTEEGPGTHVVPNLNSSTEYDFTLYSVFEDIRSTGANLTASTVPSKVNGFKAVSENEKNITLQWNNENKNINYSLWFNEEYTHFTAKDFGETANYTVLNLNDTTIYNFTLFTVFLNKSGDGVSISAATKPRNPTGFKARNQTSSTITLQWVKVNDVQQYQLEYETIEHTDNQTKSVNASSGDIVEVDIENLKNGTLYKFTLYTIFANVQSHGISHEAPTVPLQVSSVVVDRNLTNITLSWMRKKHDWNYLVYIDGSTDKKNITDGNTVTFYGLKPGTVYSYSIQTEFHGLQSTAFKDETVTVIDCSKVNWQVTETSIQGSVEGAFTNATASNGSVHLNSGSNKEVNFTDLYPGANYNVTLMYKDLLQCSNNQTTTPPELAAVCKDWDAGYSIYVEWTITFGIWDSVEVSVSNNEHKVIENMEVYYAVIPNVQPARKYEVTVTSLSGPRRSKPCSFTCQTDSRGVIAGAFFGVFIFLVLVCVVAFVMLRRPDIIRNKKRSLNGQAKSLVKKKYIPLDKFPAQFSELSADENKGFSLDYEELASVGTEQTQNAATMQENRPKNRFINVLPYDRSRVKLTSSSPQNDYINASYMPGYNSDREFIAAQGPLPNTVNDFWRMIWEQQVTGIVMVTNCTEGGRIKCEQYWPESNPRHCGDLEVFTTSEKKQLDWTLREFKVKQRRTSEERTVRHFHFTAWPDHGVPQGTQVLIQFRELVRQHMQTEAAGTPTVVHCSAGVGRTGTLIALDMLLQQMEKEKAVDIYGFVYKMRLNRPHMVQTESQYVFLHQCILDSLLQNEKHDENIYENELIYANATALREFENNKNKP
ncbi:hypothetical protein NQD34_014193 [Periophthalmus magnuspinnatus]|nr:hypothetical protein NQD34_014193 [Periophthalmus magnuspinnatus]